MIRPQKAKHFLRKYYPTQTPTLFIFLCRANKTLAKNVLVECEYHDIYMINISCIDFAIILGNAPDNAIDAVSANESAEKRTVQLIIKVKEEQIIVIVKNLTAKTSTYA